MTEMPALVTGPRPVGLPELCLPEPLSKVQWHVLMSIMDTVISSARKNEPLNPDVAHLTDIDYNEAIRHLRQSTALKPSDATIFDTFLAERPSEMPLFQDILKRMLGGLPDDKLSALRSTMSFLNHWATALPLTGYLKPFPQLSIEDRTRVLHSWRTSSLVNFRLLFKQLTFIAKHTYIRASSTFNSVSGYPSVPSGWQPVESYPFEFMQFDSSRTPIHLETDVIVVGSGCGAGVVARNIATAGYRVIVVDKGYHLPTSSLPIDHSEAFFHLFEEGGMIASEDGSVTVTAGSCFGGGGTVNWSASLQTQNTVRDEWADERGLPFFKSSEFQTCLDSVSERMGVSDKFIRHNHGNSALLEGARKLGFTAKAVPQNSGGCEHHDGHCALGCWKGEKRGPVNGWFPDAAKCGAKFLEGFKVDKVLLSKNKGKQVALGVTGIWTPRSCGGATAVSRAVTIKAERVVISAGSLWSPVILMKSGLRNKHIGRNLHLHPTTFVAGIFKEETRPWEGGILTSVVSSLDDLDGKGHGVKLERASMIPSMSLPWLGWSSGIDYKILLSKYAHAEVFIAITRDRDSGQVMIDPTQGTPRVVYTPSKFDSRHNLLGMIALAKVLYIQGAEEIHPALPGLQPFIRVQEEPSTNHNEVKDVDPRAGITNKRFQTWLRDMESHSIKMPDTPFGSAHQMSSCRMSTRETDGVVDEYGKVWGCEGLYVADASILPSASGVNPMITIMAICERVASAIVQDLAVKAQEMARM